VSVKIPANFLILLNGPHVAALTTVMPDGQPQTTVVWCNFDGMHVLFTTVRGFRKEKNVRANPQVALLAYDLHEPLRTIEVRGAVVDMTEEGAVDHLDSLSLLYTGHASYYGGCVPSTLQSSEIPVLCRILPTHVVTLDATRKERERS
jgi:PPOX class probable F420-dependent enzyme